MRVLLCLPLGMSAATISVQECQEALACAIKVASKPNPSRTHLANGLETLALKLGAVPRKPRKKTPTPKGGPIPGGTQNLSKKEAEGLRNLVDNLDNALSYVDSEWDDIRERIDQALKDEVISKGADLTEYWSNSRGLYKVPMAISGGLENLTTSLEAIVKDTKETDLVAAVSSFAKKYPDDSEGLPGSKDDSKFVELRDLLRRAKDQVPENLSKVSELTKLKKCFEYLAQVAKLLGGSVAVPKIPNALDEEDPRQLKMFTARIANSKDLKTILESLLVRASLPHPKASVLAEACMDVVESLRA